MNVDKVKLIAHNLKLLAESLEDAIKEDPDSYLKSDIDPKTGLWTVSYTHLTLPTNREV